MNNSGCNTELACETLNLLLDSFAPITAAVAYEIAYKNLDISQVEEKYPETLKIYFSKIASAVEKGEFYTSLSYDEDFVAAPYIVCFDLKIKKYLESLGYQVTKYGGRYNKEYIWITWDNLFLL